MQKQRCLQLKWSNPTHDYMSRCIKRWVESVCFFHSFVTCCPLLFPPLHHYQNDKRRRKKRARERDMDLDWVATFLKDYEWLIEYLRNMVKPAAALAVVLLAVALSYSQKRSLEGDMIYSVLRSFLQLSVIGFVLQFIFNQENAGWIILAYLFMVTQ